MSKNIEKTLSTRTIFALSDLPEDEIAELLEQDEEQKRSEVEISTSLSQEESGLFFQIAAELARGGMPYGRAIILLARYACTIEDRVRGTGFFC